MECLLKLIKLISGLHCWGKVRKKTERKNEGTRVAKCIFFYTDQNRQTRFYPKKGRNSRPFYHLTKKNTKRTKTSQKRVDFANLLFLQTFYPNLPILHGYIATLAENWHPEKIVSYFCCTHFTNFNSIFQFNRQKRANRSHHWGE